MKAKWLRRSLFWLGCTSALGGLLGALPAGAEAASSTSSGSCITQTVYVGNPPLTVTVCTPWV